MSSAKRLSPREAKAITKTSVLNGHTYQYLLAEPSDGNFRATIFLIHGWPDSSFGWRYQVPFLVSQGLRVVAPDMMGYGGTDAPAVPPNDISLYGFKRAADNIAALAKELKAPRIILGGHDWGGMIVYRTAQWHPQLVSHLFVVCTPYWAPQKRFVPTEELVKGPLPNFGYQLHLASGEIERAVRTRDQIEQFLRGVHGGSTPKGSYFLDPYKGVDLELIGQVGKSPFFDDDEMQYFADQYARNGMHGTLNWYRNREANFKDELNLAHKEMDFPLLFILANKDPVLSKGMAAGMGQLTKVTLAEVTAGHWALVQASDEVNGHIEHWLDNVVFADKSKM